MGVLNKIPCIYYLLQFRKNKDKNVLALLDLESKLNAMIPAYIAQLGLKMRETNVSAQKIDEFSLKTYKIVITTFQVPEKLNYSCFFDQTFLLAKRSIEVILCMLFLTFNNANIQFTKKKLTLRAYTTKKAPPTICWLELIDKKKFIKAALDEITKVFVVHVSFPSLRLRMTINLAKKTQIALLLAKKFTIPAKYSDFANVFLEKLANVLLE